MDEEPYDHLRARAEALLGRPLPRVLRRWAGVYSEVTGTSAFTTDPWSRPAWCSSPARAGAA